MPINQFTDFASQLSDFRNDLFGVDESGSQQMFTSEGMAAPLPCYFSPVRDKRQLEETLMKDTHDCIVRIKKAVAAAALPPFEPRLGQIVTLLKARNDGGNLTISFNEFGHSGVNPEFVIGCGNVL